MIDKDYIIKIIEEERQKWINHTEYQEEKKLLAIDKEGKYVLSNRLANVKPEESSIEENRVEENVPSEQKDTTNKKKVGGYIDEVAKRFVP